VSHLPIVRETLFAVVRSQLVTGLAFAQRAAGMRGNGEAAAAEEQARLARSVYESAVKLRETLQFDEDQAFEIDRGLERLEQALGIGR